MISDDTIKTQVYFRPAKLHTQLRNAAEEQRTTMSRLVSRYCAEGLARDQTSRPGSPSPPHGAGPGPGGQP